MSRFMTCNLDIQGLDLTPYLSGPQRLQPDANMYNLIGVSLHSGRECLIPVLRVISYNCLRNRIWPLHGLRAQLCVRQEQFLFSLFDLDSDNQWYNCNDSYCRLASPSSVQSDNAYLLFYKVAESAILSIHSIFMHLTARGYPWLDG